MKTIHQSEHDSQLSESDKYFSLFDHLLEGCQIIGFDWRYIYLNQTAVIHNKRPKDELLGRRYMDMWPGIENTPVFKIIEQVLEKRVPNHFENEFIFPDGSLGWFDLSIQPVPQGVFILSIDITERKRKEEQLYESEFRFGKLWENGPFGLMIVDQEFQYKNVNPEFCKMLGYSEAELKQLTFKDISHPDDLVKDLPNIRKLINRELSVYKTEKRYIRKDGQVIWGALTVTSNYDKEGRFLYNLAIVEDITRRKLAEEALREREKKLSTILNILPVGISILDQDHKVVYENQALEYILGITKEGIQRGDYRDRKYFRSDGTLKPAEEFASSRVFSEKTAQHNFITGVMKEDGNTIWTNVSAVPVEFPDWKAVLVTTDITERIKADEKLEDTYNLLRIAGEKAKLGGWKVNLEENHAYWSEQVAAIHGMPVGYSPMVEDGINFYAPEWREKITEVFSRCVNEGVPYDEEMEIITSTGKRVWVRTIGEPVRDENGKIIKVQGAFQDITERKQAEEALRKSENEFRTLAESMPQIVWATRADGYNIYFNQQWMDYTGMTPEESYGHGWNKTFHPDDKKAALDAWQNAVNNKGIYSIEARLRHFDGEYRWWLVRGVPLIDENGTVQKWFGTCTDIEEIKQTGNELAESEKTFRMLFESINDSILVAQLNDDQSFNYINVNDIACKLYGYTKEEFLTKTPNDIISENGKKDLKERTQKLLNNKITVYETEHVKKDGQNFPVEISTRNTQILNETIFTAIVRDITERKRVELALLESEELFSRAFRSSPIGITITNQNNGKFIEVNKAWCNIYGFTIEEAIGHTAEELAIIDSETRHRIINEIKAKGTLTSIELSLRDKRGNYHTILFSSENIEIAGEPCVLSTGIDITDRKLAEKALKENNSRLELAMQSANMAWWEMDIITGSVIFDQRKSEMLGYPAEKFKHYKDFMSLVHHEDSDKAMKAMQRHIDGLTDKYEIEYRILTRSGEYKWFYDIGAIVKNDPKGLPLLATGLVIDISERKQAEEKIKMLNEELEERVIQRTTQLEDANKELEAFSYSVSHDLRSPLRHINGFAEILTKQYSDNLPEDAKKYLNTITGSAKKMGILIDDLLSFSRTGRAELKKATLKMNQVIEDSIAQIQPSLKDRKIDWKISPLPEVNGDYNLLRLAWINLLDNAVKYTRYKEKAVIQIGFKDEIGNIIFYIQDNGVGFDMKYADKLFGVFQRLHSSSQFDGTGIGLANVQRIIFRHGGRTWAEAETDKGATFYFSIPKEKEDKR